MDHYFSSLIFIYNKLHLQLHNGLLDWISSYPCYILCCPHSWSLRELPDKLFAPKACHRLCFQERSQLRHWLHLVSHHYPRRLMWSKDTCSNLEHACVIFYSETLWHIDKTFRNCRNETDQKHWFERSLLLRKVCLSTGLETTNNLGIDFTWGHSWWSDFTNVY